MTEEADVQSWDSSLDEDCPRKYSGAEDISVSPTYEHISTSSIFIVQAT